LALRAWFLKVIQIDPIFFSMAGKQYFEEGASIYKPPLLCGLNYKYWEARMKIFVESIDQGIWDSIENGPYIPKFKKKWFFHYKTLVSMDQ